VVWVLVFVGEEAGAAQRGYAAGVQAEVGGWGVVRVAGEGWVGGLGEHYNLYGVNNWGVSRGC
jgi:hypothetical protein